MKPLQAGTPGLPDTKRLLGQLDSGSVQEFRPGDIVAARRNLQIGEQVVISQGQRFRIERSAGDDSGEFYLTDGDGERRRTSRGHLDFIRRGVEPREGEIWIAANDLPITDIHGVKGSRFVARGQHLEIVVASNSEGKLKVVDTEGTHYWIREMLLDPYVEDSRGVIPEPSRGTNRSLEEPAALNSTSSATTTEIYEHLRNLGKLREEGILSEEEFQTKKAELLARL